MAVLTPLRTGVRWWVGYPILWGIVALAYFEYHDRRLRTMEPPDWAWITLVSVAVLYIDGEVL